MRGVTKIAAVVAAGAVALGVSACGGGGSTPQQNEGRIQQDSYAKLTLQQPAVSMAYSPTRDTINAWIKQWGKPGKLAYVYLLASNGQLVGYYIFKGPPVSNCAALTPTYRVYNDGNGNLLTPAPSLDGVYYSGGQCDLYYGIDATSGTVIEFTAGNGISPLIYSEPLPRQNVEPLGFATVENVKQP